MNKLNLCWDIPESMLIPFDELKEYLGRIYDEMAQDKKYKFIKEIYTREEYIETFSKALL